MQHESPTRGSKKLLEELAKKGAGSSPEEIKAAVAVPANADYKLLDWHMRGIPAFWELEAVFQVSPPQLGQAVTHFAENAAIRNIDILINGIPKPDIAQVTVIVSQE
jgi:hypothetical protein